MKPRRTDSLLVPGPAHAVGSVILVWFGIGAIAIGRIAHSGGSGYTEGPLAREVGVIVALGGIIEFVVLYWRPWDTNKDYDLWPLKFEERTNLHDTTDGNEDDSSKGR